MGEYLDFRKTSLEITERAVNPAVSDKTPGPRPDLLRRQDKQAYKTGLDRVVRVIWRQRGGAVPQAEKRARAINGGDGADSCARLLHPADRSDTPHFISYCS
ncbi:hypothetical protein J6590_017319 [Homalodisca vitripennis]|nr:hypothetical protein J6590_017319 [Homalodisca vitripennis]